MPLVLPLVVIRCHSLSLDVPLVCLFINDRHSCTDLSKTVFLCEYREEATRFSIAQWRFIFHLYFSNHHVQLKNFCHYLFAFIFKCMNALASSLTPFISFNERFLIKGLLWRGRGSLNSKWKQTGSGGVKPISMLTLWKKLPNVSFYLSLSPSVSLSLSFFSLSLYIYLSLSLFIYIHCHLLCWVCKKIILFFLYTPQFFIRKFISILHIKWTGMNKGEQVDNLKFWVDILFEWPQSLFAATKILFQSSI